MKHYLSSIFCLFLLFNACSSYKNSSNGKHEEVLPQYIKNISIEALRAHLYTFASDEFEGRMTGEEGQKKAANYIRDFYIKNEIQSPESPFVNEYFQTIPANTFPRIKKETENVLGFIKGSEIPDEVLVISAHYDHEGIRNGEIYNGADDNASGSVAILEIAKAFKEAEKNGFPPKRSILFLHFTAEELGLLGSRFYTDMQAVFPLENTIANLNIDMIGRVDANHLENENYLYLIGSDRLSTDLHTISEKVNEKYIQMDLDYTYNAINDPNRYYYRSDHYNFAKNNIPVVFYFNGIHEDYHKSTDTSDKINYNLLTKRTQLIFATAWAIVNADERPKLNEE